MKKAIILRDETKENEQRSPLTPQAALELIQEGIDVFVERSETRIFPTQEYQNRGCKIINTGDWKTFSQDHIILGLKELPISNEPLIHKHIYFAHIFKGQDGSKEVFERFTKGGGELYDLEFLKDENEKRVCAFGYWAGYVGAALSLMDYFSPHGLQQLKSFPNKDILLKEIQGEAQGLQTPKAIIIGSNGRCGTGAQDLFKSFNIQTTNWDREETSNGGPFPEILEHDIFVNAALIFKKINPFINKELFQSQKSSLKVIADVSCDPTSDLNPIPLYNQATSWKEPTLKLEIEKEKIDIIAVDNLPSVLPKESSEDFSKQLFPHLLNFLKRDDSSVPFIKAKDYFKKVRATY